MRVKVSQIAFGIPLTKGPVIQKTPPCYTVTMPTRMTYIALTTYSRCTFLSNKHPLTVGSFIRPKHEQIPIHRRRFQMNSISMNASVYNSITILQYHVPNGSIDNKSAMAQVMDCWQTSAKSLSEPIMMQFTDMHLVISGAIQRFFRRISTSMENWF